MSNLTVTKQALRLISSVVPRLPVVYEHSTEEHFVYGRELIEQGMTEDIESGAKIIPDIMYMQKMPVMIAVNHTRRLKERFKKEGIDGVVRYINSITELVKHQE